MNDILAVAFGVLLGVLASIPVALVIAASVNSSQYRRLRETWRVEILPPIEQQETGVIVWQAEGADVVERG